MSQPTLPVLPKLNLPPEVMTIGSMLIGLATLVTTTFGVSPDVTNAVVLGIQYALAAIFILGGVAGHLHIHNQHVSLARAQMEIAGVQAAASVPLPPPPATSAPVSPSYAPTSTPLGPLNPAATGTVVVNPATIATDSTAPQPPAADTPTQVVAKVPDATPAPAQAATDAT